MVISELLAQVEREFSDLFPRGSTSVETAPQAEFARRNLMDTATCGNFLAGATRLRAAAVAARLYGSHAEPAAHEALDGLYRQLDAAPALLAAVRHACDGLVLKVILETGELADAQQVALACRIALEAGADFLKTSTGKVRVNATPQAAQTLLQAIACLHPNARPCAYPMHGWQLGQTYASV
jgi:hypothetical protein